MKFAENLRGKRVFITGHTGFKGSWLLLLLHKLGAKVTGYALPPPTDPSLFAVARLCDFVECHHEADVRDAETLAVALAAAEPDVVFHLAAQPLVRLSYREPFDTFATNVMGTAAVLEAVRLRQRPCVVVVITSDKCYEPHADGRPHAESDRLGGRDPYSASKGAAELVSAAYQRCFFTPERLEEHGVQVATVRAGNVIGGGDWAADRIITDIVRHLLVGKPVPVRNPGAIRPWQHVLEPLSGYLALADEMVTNPDARWCTGWNFGPVEGDDVTVAQLVELFIEAWGAGSWRDLSDPRAPGETHALRLATSKARGQLSWEPCWSAASAIQRTAEWFRAFSADSRIARELCLRDIAAFEAVLPSRREVSSA